MIHFSWNIFGCNVTKFWLMQKSLCLRFIVCICFYNLTESCLANLNAEDNVGYQFFSFLSFSFFSLHFVDKNLEIRHSICKVKLQKVMHEIGFYACLVTF